MCLCKGICVCRLRMKYCVFSAYEIVYLLESIHTRTLKKEILLKTQINNYAANTGWKSERLLMCMVRLHCTLQEGAAAELTQSFWFWFGAATVHPTELLPEMQEWKEYICCSRPFSRDMGFVPLGRNCTLGIKWQHHTYKFYILTLLSFFQVSLTTKQTDSCHWK